MKKLPLLLLSLCAAALLPGCDNHGGGPQKKLRLAFVANTADNYWSVVQLGCDYAARQLGDVDLEFRVPAVRTAEAQQTMLGELVADGADGIAISPIDADRQTDFLNSVAAKTLLICADSDAANSRRTCYIGTDNVSAGQQAAELIKAALPQGGKIILLVGYAKAQNTLDRVSGIQSGLAGSNIQIIGTLSDEHDSAIGQKNAEEALAKNPDLAGMVGIYGYHGPAILTAVRSAGKTGQVKIVCFDDDSDTLAGIASGDIYGTVVQSPLDIGWQTIINMERYLRGDKTQLAGGKFLIPSRPITQKNIVNFMEDQQALLVKLKQLRP
jgi:ribose transport system substrate-binding protein